MNHNLSIGISHGGSLGDNLNLSVLSAAVKRFAPHSYITAIVPKYPDIYRDSKTVDRVITCNTLNFQTFVDKRKKDFDLFLEFRYCCKWYFSEKSLRIPAIRKFKLEWENKFKKYEYCFNKFLGDIPAHENFGKTWWELALASSNLTGYAEDQFLSIHPEDYEASDKYKGLRYVTLSNGAAGGLQTKSWYQPYWNHIAKYLKQMGFVPIQVGVKEEPPIENAERFVGNLFQTAALIKNSFFHIGIENGLSHVAATTGITSIILFSSTPVKFFGYSQNINIRSKVCSPCFWRHQDWFHTCIRENKKKVTKEWAPPCMQALFPKDVKKAIKELLKRKGYNVKFLEPNDTMDESSLKTSLWHKEVSILKKAEGTKQYLYEKDAANLPEDFSKEYENLAKMKRIHAILNIVGAGKKVLMLNDGRGYVSNLLRMQGNKVVMTDNSEISVLRAKFVHKLDAYQCPIEKLPFKDKSFDVVIADEVLGKAESIGKAMLECERVCKDSGQIIWTLPVDSSKQASSSNFWDIKQDTIENSTVMMNLKKISPSIDEFKRA